MDVDSSPSQQIETPKRVDFGLVMPHAKNYESLLKESINRFLQEHPNESSSAPDFSGFRSIFFRLIQATPSPPLEIIWFYSAISYHDTNLNLLKQKADGRDDRLLTAAKSLFQLIAACSASSEDPTNSIALLAPLLFKLHSLLEKNNSAKTEHKKKFTREFECVIEGVVSYICICVSKNSFCGRCDVGLGACFRDLIRVWTVDSDLDGGEGGLRMFFPLVADGFLDEFRREGCGVGYLTGVVIAEAFLMRLCFKLSGGSGGLKSDLKELRVLAVGLLTSFRSSEFFEVLLRLILEPSLPVSSLLNSDDEAILGEVLYDVVILVDYSFLTSECEFEQFDNHKKGLFMLRLLVVHKAIRAARANGDQTKAISYINAFSRSRLPSELIAWAAGQIGMEIPNRLNVNTPQALLKWLLNLEDLDLRLKLHSSSRTKLLFDELMLDNEYSIPKIGSKKTEGDIFYMDKKGEEAEKNAGEDQEMQSEDTLFLAAAKTMRSTSNGGRRKRREGGRGGRSDETQVKFLKYSIDDSPVKENTPSSRVDGGMHSEESEVENPLSDEEDIEEMEQ